MIKNTREKPSQYYYYYNNNNNNYNVPSIMLTGKLFVKKLDINLKMILEGGQCFRWKEISENTWRGVVSNCVWTLTREENCILYNVHGTEDKVKVSGLGALSCDEFLKAYLRIDENLTELYDTWGSNDEHFKKVAGNCYGIRVLFQEPVENLFSFICSSNNNITRISKMVEKLSSLYGTKIAEIDGNTYYGFPCVSSLNSTDIEATLRHESFGYRAKFIKQSAKYLDSLGGEDWILGLRSLTYREAKAELIKFPGIGAKVADCICLMSLGHLEALPVDTHVFQIASKYYIPRLQSVKSVTDKVYNEIGDHFRNLYGNKAGWAHTVLFCADLKMFQNDNLKRGSVERKGKAKKHKT